jgi:co-chaperonin GroES (HSP10)
MLKPRNNYVVIEAKEVKSKSGIIVGSVTKDNSLKELIVESVGKEVEGLKKGDSVVISSDARLMGVKTEKGDRIIVSQDDIIAVK